MREVSSCALEKVNPCQLYCIKNCVHCHLIIHHFLSYTVAHVPFTSQVRSWTLYNRTVYHWKRLTGSVAIWTFTVKSFTYTHCVIISVITGLENKTKNEDVCKIKPVCCMHTHPTHILSIFLCFAVWLRTEDTIIVDRVKRLHEWESLEFVAPLLKELCNEILPLSY